MTDNLQEVSAQEGGRQAGDFSPRILILQILSGIKFLFRQWKIILSAAVLMALVGYLTAYFKKPTYIAEITFALDEGAAQSAKTEYTQLSEQLGIGSLMDAGGVFSSATNIVELMQSRLMIEKTLRNTTQVGNRKLVFADFFLDSLDYRKKWLNGIAGNDSLLFKQVKKAVKDSLLENGIIRNMYETLLAKYLKIEKKGKSTSIIAVTCNTEHELFSKYFLEALIKEVTAYYIATKIQRAKSNVDFLVHRTDSMRNAFSSALYGHASFADAHLNPAMQVSIVPAERQQTEVQVNRTAYIDLVRSLETARTTLMRETPLIQYIDTPVLPLKIIQTGAMKKGWLFFFVGICLASVILLSVRTYQLILLQH